MAFPSNKMLLKILGTSAKSVFKEFAVFLIMTWTVAIVLWLIIHFVFGLKVSVATVYVFYVGFIGIATLLNILYKKTPLEKNQ